MSKINRRNFTDKFNAELDSFKESGGLTLPLSTVTKLSARLSGVSVTIRWNDPEDLVINAEDGTPIALAEWEGTKIIRKLNSEPTNMADGDLVIDSKIRNAYSNADFKDTDVVVGGTYFYRAFPYSTNGVVTNGSSVSIKVLKITGPGPATIIAGDETAGFYGEVPNANLITPEDLYLMVGYSFGAVMSANAPWLKFSLDDKVLFVMKKPISHSVSWNNLKSLNLIYGDKTIKIGAHTYKVRLLKGASRNPYDYSTEDHDAKGSEWNRLMLPIHINAKNKSWAFPSGVESDLPDWEIGYTDQDLLASLTYGNGSMSWCQENTADNLYLSRGGTDASFPVHRASNRTDASFGWRPVLELVQ